MQQTRRIGSGPETVLLLSARILGTSHKMEKNHLLTSTRRRARRTRASPDALICCCSKHLKLPQSSRESGLTRYMYST